MPTYIRKDKEEMLRAALQKLQSETDITAVGPGSVARSLVEAVVDELHEFYDVLDFNMSMSLVSTAQGRALDLLGKLYNVTRKEIGNAATIEQIVGAFYFYLDSPVGHNITIPSGTRVSTGRDGLIGDSYTYVTTQNAIIPIGRTRAYVSIKPIFADSVFTAGTNTLVNHNYEDPQLATIKCTNPKPIVPQIGFESDANYRARIVKQLRVTNGGTSEAIRFAALAVPGIRDVVVGNNIYGLGTVGIVIVPEDRNQANVITAAINAIQQAKPVGVKTFIRQPDYLSLSLRGEIVYRERNGLDKQSVRKRVRNRIVRYLNTLLPGDTLIYNRIIEAALDASDDVLDFAVERLTVGGVEILRSNYVVSNTEQIIPGDILP